jgi:hypothetical protein
VVKLHAAAVEREDQSLADLIELGNSHSELFIPTSMDCPSISGHRLRRASMSDGTKVGQEQAAARQRAERLLSPKDRAGNIRSKTFKIGADQPLQAAQQRAEAAKTARLRDLRMAKEAADRAATTPPPKRKKTRS